ncbi:MAG: restriction endonuclease subunit S [Bdellovibrionaceae bacterium]|nr:restriction endonuclease subunit S [Pseudobdellovibrionaceae bacterium]
MTATKATFSKYRAYKDSGEYWMGEIPDHWEIKKLKHFFHEKKKVTNPDLNCGSISYGKVVFKDDEKIPESTKASYQEVLAGEFLINPLNLNYDLVSLRIGLSEINVVVSSGYIVLKNSIDINKSYFNYLLHRYDVAYMKLLGSGVRQTINFNHISNSLLAFPPIEEQTAIANFLDDKTAKIDRAIAQKEKMIVLLKERKQIIIQDLVTGKKVWNPGQNAWTEPAEVKHSGVEWIGEIPEGWEMKRLRFIGTTQNGISAGAEYFGEGYPFVSYSDVYKNIELPVSVDGLAKSTDEDQQNYSVKEGDIFFTRTSETIEEIGFSSTCLKTIEKATFAGFLIRFRPKDKFLDPTFSKYYFSSKLHRAFFVKEMNLVIRASLSQELLKKLPVLLPPLAEQKTIAKHIETQSAKIDKTIALQEKQIEKLKELKSTLIDSAVTGKIKVNSFK